MRRAARAIADQLGVDFKEARKILIDTWREHRRARSEVLAQQAALAGLDPEEREADF
jgi:predicted metal-dependent hydrolase